MGSHLEVVGTAYRLLVDESQIPVDAQRVSEAALAPGGGETPWAAVHAMARAVGDPHTVLVSPAAGPRLQALVFGKNSSHPGFTVHRCADACFVVGEVVSGAPADMAGLRPGDEVVSIDDQPVSHGFEDVLELMGRPEGSSASLRVLRAGAPLDMSLVVNSAPPLLIDWKVVSPGVGYVRLRFVTTSDDPTRDGAALVTRAVTELGGNTLRGLILDLRSNPGGYGVTRVASVLTDRKPLARYRDARGNEELAQRTDATPAFACPIVVLVDDQTVSSAELIALALQDHGVARVVGQPTAGGLTVPRYVPLGDGYVLMTPERIALAPSTGRVPEGRRVRPDVLIPNRTPEDFAKGRDRQLECALELLSNDPSDGGKIFPCSSEEFSR
jgi:carboxyl-terminal processing protease